MASDPRRPAGGDSDWLTLGQAAKFLGVAQSTIRKWSDVGRVPAFYTPGGHRRYRRSGLDRFLERSRPGRGGGGARGGGRGGGGAARARGRRRSAGAPARAGQPRARGLHGARGRQRDGG